MLAVNENAAASSLPVFPILETSVATLNTALAAILLSRILLTCTEIAALLNANRSVPSRFVIMAVCVNAAVNTASTFTVLFTANDDANDDVIAALAETKSKK